MDRKVRNVSMGVDHAIVSVDFTIDKKEFESLILDSLFPNDTDEIAPIPSAIVEELFICPVEDGHDWRSESVHDSLCPLCKPAPKEFRHPHEDPIEAEHTTEQKIKKIFNQELEADFRESAVPLTPERVNEVGPEPPLSRADWNHPDNSAPEEPATSCHGSPIVQDSSLNNEPPLNELNDVKPKVVEKPEPCERCGKGKRAGKHAKLCIKCRDKAFAERRKKSLHGRWPDKYDKNGDKIEQPSEKVTEDDKSQLKQLKEVNQLKDEKSEKAEKSIDGYTTTELRAKIDEYIDKGLTETRDVAQEIFGAEANNKHKMRIHPYLKKRLKAREVDEPETVEEHIKKTAEGLDKLKDEQKDISDDHLSQPPQDESQPIASDNDPTLSEFQQKIVDVVKDGVYSTHAMITKIEGHHEPSGTSTYQRYIINLKSLVECGILNKTRGRPTGHGSYQSLYHMAGTMAPDPTVLEAEKKVKAYEDKYHATGLMDKVNSINWDYIKPAFENVSMKEGDKMMTPKRLAASAGLGDLAPEEFIWLMEMNETFEEMVKDKTGYDFQIATEKGLKVIYISGIYESEA